MISQGTDLVAAEVDACVWAVMSAFSWGNAFYRIVIFRQNEYVA